MCVPSLEDESSECQMKALTQETEMYFSQEPFVQAELEFRRDRIRSQFAASAQRKAARRARRLPAARRVAGHLSGRLATGS